jgi:hypothetical protein
MVSAIRGITLESQELFYFCLYFSSFLSFILEGILFIVVHHLLIPPPTLSYNLHTVPSHSIILCLTTLLKSKARGVFRVDLRALLLQKLLRLSAH